MVGVFAFHSMSTIGRGGTSQKAIELVVDCRELVSGSCEMEPDRLDVGLGTRVDGRHVGVGLGRVVADRSQLKLATRNCHRPKNKQHDQRQQRGTGYQQRKADQTGFRIGETSLTFTAITMP